MNKDPSAYLLLMRDACTKIHSFISDMSYEEFTTSAIAQSAVLMQLQVIGELSKKVPEETKKEIPISWKQMAGLRDMVSHDYFRIDIKSIWDTAQKDTKDAEEKIKQYLEVKL